MTGFFIFMVQMDNTGCGVCARAKGERRLPMPPLATSRKETATLTKCCAVLQCRTIALWRRVETVRLLRGEGVNPHEIDLAKGY